MMRKMALLAISLIIQFMAVQSLWAQEQDSSEIAKAKEFFGKAGIPGDKWVEGETMDPHVRAAKHFKSAMLYYPGTEELQPDEVRVTFMGSTYYPNQSQSGMSIFVQLGNGDNIVFDLGIGSLRNYNSFSIPFNTINHVFFPPAHGPYERLVLLHHVPVDSRWLHAIAYLRPQRL
jgi:ribonuclease Z